MDVRVGEDLLLRPLLDPHGLDEGVQKRAVVVGAEHLRIRHALERLHAAGGVRVGDAEAGDPERRFVPDGVGHGWCPPSVCGYFSDRDGAAGARQFNGAFG